MPKYSTASMAIDLVKLKVVGKAIKVLQKKCIFLKVYFSRPITRITDRDIYSEKKTKLILLFSFFMLNRLSRKGGMLAP